MLMGYSGLILICSVIINSFRPKKIPEALYGEIDNHLIN
jgi:hypothetical protein